VLIVAFLAVAVYAGRETRVETRRTGKYPKGHYMGQGMGIGIAIGVAIGAAVDNIAVGIAIGVALGAGIGAGREKKHAEELRPMTEKEKTMKRRGVGLAVALLIVVMAIGVASYFLGS
jgi:hypothetical protein